MSVTTHEDGNYLYTYRTFPEPDGPALDPPEAHMRCMNCGVKCETHEACSCGEIGDNGSDKPCECCRCTCDDGEE